MTHSPTPAETYEAFMVPFRFRPWAETLIDRLDPPPGTRLLDVACGTGIVARTAAARLGDRGTVTGVDMNPAMIEVARSTGTEAGLDIEWSVGLAAALPFPDASFDIVTIQQGLQFFPDKPAALRECLRVLVSGGLLAVAVWSALEKQGIQRPYAEAIERVTGSPSMHAAYGTTTAQQLGDLIAGAGFRDVSVDEVTIDVTYDDPDGYAERMVQGTSAGVPAMHGRSDEERAELARAVAADMADAVRASTVDGRLVTESTTFIARGTRPV
jgi:ubiquinone/menaquinone biosynthesis C-methylase UbiE